MGPDVLLAILLLGLGIVLVVLEIHLPTHGILGVGGVAGAGLGGFLLLAPAATSAPVLAALVANGWPLTIASSTFAALGGTVMWTGLRARRLPVVDPLARLSGAEGVAASTLAPDGTVLVFNERWSAVTEGRPIEPGERIEVVARQGLRLRVRRIGPLHIERFGMLPSQGEVRPGIWVERTR
ncbi:MAG: NfeD family protein [Chloroflexota bacterium]